MRATPLYTIPMACCWWPMIPSFPWRRPCVQNPISIPQTMVVERTFNRLTVADTDAGREIQERIHDLEELLRAYRSGEVTEKN